jgi:hypothetical protein
LLVLAHRNDVLLYCRTDPYWLSERPFVTRHHEPHPAVTDTEVAQRAMLADIAKGPLPVLVLEHRFTDAALEKQKARFLEHLAIGAPLLDEWIQRTYAPGPRFGRYQLMVPK